MEKVLSCQEHLLDIKDPQVELQLLRSCLGLCKIKHILRTAPSLKTHRELYKFDIGLRHSLEQISHSSISDCSWRQATLPTRLGGLGLREALSTSDAAFIGSCNSSRQLTCQLLANSSSLFAGTKTPQSSGYHVESGVLILGEIQCRDRFNLSFLPTVHVI